MLLQLSRVLCERAERKASAKEDDIRSPKKFWSSSVAALGGHQLEEKGNSLFIKTMLSAANKGLPEAEGTYKCVIPPYRWWRSQFP